MLSKSYNSYQITHKNNVTEKINASSLVEALENMEVAENLSPVLQTLLVEENVRTLVSEMPAEVTFSSVVSGGSEGNIATPGTGTCHVGDTISLRAVPAKGNTFVCWKVNGVVLSNSASVIYEIPELENGITTLSFVAEFALSPVEWSAEVSDPEATTAGCLVFPASGTTLVGSKVELIAVAKGDYTFSHWLKNGVDTGLTNEILDYTMVSLGENENECVFTAVFTEN